jgi:hypothetical protein
VVQGGAARKLLRGSSRRQASASAGGQMVTAGPFAHSHGRRGGPDNHADIAP